MSFPSVVRISSDDALVTSTTKTSRFGQKAVDEYGRVFRYARGGAIAITAGLNNQALATTTNWTDEAIATLAAGVSVLTGVGATTGSCAADLLVDGWCYSTTATNTNPIMRIKSNTVITLIDTTGTITLYQPTLAAFAVADTITYAPNTWNNIIICPTALTGQLAGVALVDIAVGSYGWVQTGGTCKVLYDATGATIGLLAGPSNSVAGCAELWVPAVSLTQCLGTCMLTESVSTYGPIFLQLEG